MGWHLQLEFQLEFATWKEKYKWSHYSVYNRLRALVAKGMLERCHNPSKGPTGELGRWRWKSDGAPSLDHLRALAAVAGA